MSFQLYVTLAKVHNIFNFSQVFLIIYKNLSSKFSFKFRIFHHFLNSPFNFNINFINFSRFCPSSQRMANFPAGARRKTCCRSRTIFRLSQQSCTEYWIAGRVLRPFISNARVRCREKSTCFGSFQSHTR